MRSPLISEFTVIMHSFIIFIWICLWDLISLCHKRISAISVKSISVLYAYDISSLWRPSWLYGSCICNYICNQCLWVWVPLMASCTWYNIMWSSLSVTYSRSMVFSGYSGSFTNKTDRHNITEILLKVTFQPWPIYYKSNKNNINMYAIFHLVAIIQIDLH